MSEQTAQLVARLRSRLRRTTHRINLADVVFGTAVAVGVVAATWLLAATLEATFWFGTAVRTALLASIGTVAIGVGGAVLGRPLGRLLGILPHQSDEAVARKVGHHYPDVADRLVNILHLAEGKRSYAPAPLVDEAVHMLAEDLNDVSFEKVEDFSQAREAIRLASLPFVGILAFLLFAPTTFFDASERLLAPGTEFTRPAPFELSVAPGSVRLLQGDSLQITVRSSSPSVREVALHRRDTAASPPETIALTPDSTGTFQHTVPTVREGFQYRVEAGRVDTDWYEVEVAKRPLVRSLQLRVTPPSYTGLPARELDSNVGDVSGLPGSEVHISASLSGPPVESAHLIRHGDQELPLDVRDNSATGSFTLREEGHYFVRLETAAGNQNRDPIRYQLSLQSDARPSVRFLQPKGTTPLGDDLAQELRVDLSDDYGFSQAKLFYRLSTERFGEGEEEFSSLRLPQPTPGQTDQTLTYEWLLARDTDLTPEPGDIVTYFVKAWDNDTINGPKSSRTATQRLRRPTLTEQYEQLDETQNDTGDQLERLRQRSDSVHQEFRQLREELRRTRDANWQDRRQLQRIQEKQQSVDQGVEKLSEQVEEMNRQMQKNDLSSSELSQKFQELKRVIDEIESPELQQALDELRKAMEQNDLQKMQKAMEKVKQNEESFRERLERTMSLFEQLKAQQKLEEMARRAEELSTLEEELSEKTEERMQESTSDSTQTDGTDSERQKQTRKDTPSPSDTAPSDSTGSQTGPRVENARSDSTSGSSSAPKGEGANEDLASEQERAAEKMEKLQEEMEQAADEMDGVQSAPKKQLQKLKERMDRENLPEQMRRNSQQLRQNDLQDARQGQQNMQNSLKNMQEKLSQMKSQMQGRQRKINLAGLRTALENTLLLSKRQESLRTKVDNLAAEGPTVRSYARDQNTLAEGLTTVTDSLQSIAKRVPQLTREVQQTSGNALRAMETATTALDKRNGTKATGHQKTSMMHLNELALLLSDLLEQLQQQQSSGSGMSMQQMLQQLQQMSGDQQKLNEQIQEHLNNVQGNRLTPEQSKRQKELAEQQRRIKQQLEEMDVGSEAREQVMGDLEKIMKQMEQSAQELEQERPARDLIDRQQQILTRLLNAQKSLRTQGKQPNRQGRESEDEYDQQRPGELPSTDDTDTLRRDLIRALEMGYSSDYEELIKRYFELLQNRESEPSDTP